MQVCLHSLSTIPLLHLPDPIIPSQRPAVFAFAFDICSQVPLTQPIHSLRGFCAFYLPMIDRSKTDSHFHCPKDIDAYFHVYGNALWLKKLSYHNNQTLDVIRRHQACPGESVSLFDLLVKDYLNQEYPYFLLFKMNV